MDSEESGGRLERYDNPLGWFTALIALFTLLVAATEAGVL